MELLHLKYFQKVAQTQHISKSAEELNIVQPALSRSINNLEKELGVKLFNRNGRVIELNENGKIFLNVVDDILTNLENGKKKLLDMNNKLDNEIKLVVLSATISIPNLILEFRKLYPETIFKLIQYTPDVLKSKDYDFIISSTFNKIESENNIVLLKEDIVLGVSSIHNLASKNSINLKDVENEDFIGFAKNKPFRDISDRLFNDAGINPKIVFESEMPQVVCGLVKAGVGLSLIPLKTWDIVSDDSIKLLNITSPNCNRYLNLSWNADCYLSKLALIFKDFVRQYFSKL